MAFGRGLAGPLRVTSQGLHDGAVFAARILLLLFATTLLAQTTQFVGLKVLGALRERSRRCHHGRGTFREAKRLGSSRWYRLDLPGEGLRRASDAARRLLAG